MSVVNNDAAAVSNSDSSSATQNSAFMPGREAGQVDASPPSGGSGQADAPLASGDATSAVNVGKLINGFRAVDASCSIARELSLPGDVPVDSLDLRVVQLGLRFAVLQERHATFGTLLEVEKDFDYCDTCDGLGFEGVLSSDDKPSVVYVNTGGDAVTAYSWQPGEAAPQAPSNLFSSYSTALDVSFDLATSRDGYRVIVAAGDPAVTSTLNVALLDSEAQLIAPPLTVEMDSDSWDAPAVVPTLHGAVVSVTSESADGADILWYLRGVDENGIETLSMKATVPDALARGYRAPYLVISEGAAVYSFWKNSQGEQLRMHVGVTNGEEPTVVDPWVSPPGIAYVSEGRFIAQTVELPLVRISSVSLDGMAQRELFLLSDDSQSSTVQLLAAQRQAYYVTQIVAGKRLIREVVCDAAMP